MGDEKSSEATTTTAAVSSRSPSYALPSWWKWAVLAATFYMNAIVNGYAYCFGLLKIRLEQEYPNESAVLLASIGGAISSIYMFLGPIAIAMSEYYGPRVTTIGASLFSAFCFVICWLNGVLFKAGFILDLLTLGVGQGIALGFLYGPSVALLPNYFPLQQIAFAAGATNAGTSFGIIVYGFISNPLFDYYGWRGAMLIYAMFALQGVLAGLVFRKIEPPKKPSSKQKEVLEMAEKCGETDTEKALLADTPTTDTTPTFSALLAKFFDVKLFMQWPFIMMLSAAMFSIIGYFVPTLLVPGQAKKADSGVHPFLAQYIMVIFGTLNLTGRIVIGKLGDLGFKYAICTSYSLYIASLVISAVAFLVFPHVMFMGSAAFLIFIVIYGFAAAPIITMRSVLTINLFGKANASAAYGWFLCAQGSLQMAGFMVPAWLDKNVGAVYAYAFAASAFVIAAISCAATFKPFFEARRKQIAEISAKTATT